MRRKLIIVTIVLAAITVLEAYGCWWITHTVHEHVLILPVVGGKR